MKKPLYPRLAWLGIAKNRKFYLPYILTAVGMVFMSYIMGYLSVSESVRGLHGGGTICDVLSFGYGITLIFSAVFLFYSNSFIRKRRTKELGLYSILGMNRGNIARVMAWEYFITSVISISSGIFFGALFSKLFEIALVRIMGQSPAFAFTVSTDAALRTALCFLAIFFLIFLFSLLRIGFLNPIKMVKSAAAGEKAPRANVFLALLGVALLAGAYYIAITIYNPVAALSYFFVAVVMVIFGTYFIFVASSVAVCRILGKNKKFYYNKNHFVSVSQMAYRMKRNGAGLASVCILATMVLVMMSSSASLYFGKEKSLKLRYPGEIESTLYAENMASLDEKNISPVREKIKNAASSRGASVDVVRENVTASFTAYLVGEYVDVYPGNYPSYSYDDYTLFRFFSLREYNKVFGANETLEDGEVIAYFFLKDFEGDTIKFSTGDELTIKKRLDSFELVNGDDVGNVTPTVYIVTPDIEKSVESIEKFLRGKWDNANGEYYDFLSRSWSFCFDTEADDEVQRALGEDIQKILSDVGDGFSRYTLNVRAEKRAEFYALDGGIFFIGITLSIVFIFAAVLIIYYKQTAEGYEDASRFEIMQKVGMTKREIRKNINSQLLTVFYMPLVGAGCHLVFAFPMIRKMLLLFGLDSVKLFVTVTAVSFAVFALFYAAVYKVTSNSYFEIVSGRENARTGD